MKVDAGGRLRPAADPCNKAGKDIKIPTDLLGIRPVTYSLDASSELMSAIAPVCTELRKIILNSEQSKRTREMGLFADLQTEVIGIFANLWEVSEARVVPEPTSLKLSNDARHFDRATILYADLSGSTSMVNNYSWQVAGEIYKTYLLCAAKIIRSQEGEITAYDGDRIMAIFVGDTQTSNAAKCGLKINWAVINIINPALKAQYANNGYIVKQVVGIDTSEIRAAKIGVRGGNDLVWIGRAANYAAKLTECRSDYPTWLTAEAYGRLMESEKNSGTPARNMWKEFKWTAMNDIKVYGSNWRWPIE